MNRLERIRQREWRDPYLTWRVARALSTMADVGASIISEEEYDITPLITKMRNDPDQVMAWVYAALIVIEWDADAVKSVRESANAIRQWTHAVAPPGEGK